MFRLLPLFLLPTAALAQSEPVSQGPANTDYAPAFAEQTRAPALADTSVSTAVFAEGLEHPWGIASLPGGQYLVTERPGRMRVITADGGLSAEIGGLPQVDPRGQGGLLDVAVGPDFATDRTVWWSYAKPVDSGSVTAVARGTLAADWSEMSDVRDIWLQSPAVDTPQHYGSRLVFDGQGNLYITTGERSSVRNRVLAQDLDATYGKVIRITPDGSIPADNPFVGLPGDGSIWSFGHRNIQGAALQPQTGALWTVEHGPAGGDELNQPMAGFNYGWPMVSYGVNYNGSALGEGQTSMEGVTEPVYYWDPVIAPGGMLFYQGESFADWQGDLLIAGLNPGALVRLEMQDGQVTGEEHLLTDLGRIRDVEEMADGDLLLLIDDADGAVIRVSPGE